MIPETTKGFFHITRDLLDDDLKVVHDMMDVQPSLIVLVQILRELRNKGPEERSAPVAGFRGGSNV